MSSEHEQRKLRGSMHCAHGSPHSLPQVNVLMRAYAFLMECGQMSWQQLEEKAIQPYNSEAGGWGAGRSGRSVSSGAFEESTGGASRPSPCALPRPQPPPPFGIWPTGCTACLACRSWPTRCRQGHVLDSRHPLGAVPGAVLPGCRFYCMLALHC